MKTLVAWLEALWALICGIIADLPMAFRTMLRRLHTVLCCVIHRLCAAWKSGGLGGLFPPAFRTSRAMRRSFRSTIRPGRSRTR